MPLSERARNIINFLNGFRKFTIMAILIAIAIVFRVLDYLSGKEMVELLSSTSVAFMSANGVEHVVKAVAEWAKGKGKKDVDVQE